jgi:hypothetical protein
MQLLFRNTNLLSRVLLKLQSLFYDLFVVLVSVFIARANCCLFVCCCDSITAMAAASCRAVTCRGGSSGSNLLRGRSVFGVRELGCAAVESAVEVEGWRGGREAGRMGVVERHEEQGGRGVRWVFLGCPGVGKGTYASRLAKVLQVPHIAMGDLVRHELSQSSSMAKQVCNPRSFLEKKMYFDFSWIHIHMCVSFSQLFVRPSKSYFDMSSLSLVLCVWVFILTDRF